RVNTSAQTEHVRRHFHFLHFLQSEFTGPQIDKYEPFMGFIRVRRLGLQKQSTAKRSNDMKSRDRVRVGAVGYCVLGAMLGMACSGGHEGDYAEGEHGEYTDTIVDEFGGEKPGETALPEGTRKLADVLDEAMADTAEVQSAAVDNTYAGGVIPIDGSTCPSGSSLIKIYMDDEDDENRSFATGWHLPQTLKDVPRRTNWSGTNLRFCKVNGSSFRPLTTDVSKKAYFYATLKLGQYCPNGSV